MREHDPDRDPPPADVLAGEYVLGVLGASERRDVRLRAQRDAAFARRVSDWERQLEPLHDALPAPEVPAQLWPRIRARLGWSPVERASNANVGMWKAATAAGFAMAAALAILAIQTPRVIQAPAPTVAAQTPAAPMQELPVTQLVSNGGQVTYLATVDARTGGMWLVPVPGTVTAGTKAPVLWLIAPGQKPKSLGYVGASRSHWVDVPKAELHAGMQSGWTVAITMEPVQSVAPQAPSSTPVAAGTLAL